MKLRTLYHYGLCAGVLVLTPLVGHEMQDVVEDFPRQRVQFEISINQAAPELQTFYQQFVELDQHYHEKTHPTARFQRKTVQQLNDMHAELACCDHQDFSSTDRMVRDQLIVLVDALIDEIEQNLSWGWLHDPMALAGMTLVGIGSIIMAC